MPIEFRCAGCGQTLRVPDEAAGRSARCPKCQAQMTIPAASTATPAAPPKPTGSSSPRLPPQPQVPPQPQPFPTHPFSPQPQQYPSQPPQPFLPQPPQPFSTSAPTFQPAPQSAHKPYAAFGAPPSPPPKPPEPNLNPYASSPLPPGVSAYGPPNPNQGPMIMAVASLVTGVMGLMSCGCCLFLPFPAISLALGIIALCQKSDQSAKVMATIGVVISSIVLLVFLVGLIMAAVNGAMDAQPWQDIDLE